MNRVEKVPRFIWRLMRFLPPRIAYALGLDFLVKHFVLLLKTTGRKSGLPRETALTYDEIDGILYVGSARGVKADWYRNLIANPNIEVRIGSRRIQGRADLITDPVQIADFLELRLKRHPLLVGLLFKLEGLNMPPTRTALERYAANRALAAIRPIGDD